MDLNCDMGESYGKHKIGNDLEILPYIDSCNIACGFHGGDPTTMARTMGAALKLGKNIGAHPSYPDLPGFGRKSMVLSDEELRNNIIYQIAASKGMLECLGGKLHHIKLHGALYHDVAKSRTWSTILCEIIQSIQKNLILFVPPHTILAKIAKDYKIVTWREGFADRRYLDNGKLVPRSQPQAVITDPEEAKTQIEMIRNEKRVKTISGTIIPLNVDTICLHGDTENALQIAKAIWKLKK